VRPPGLPIEDPIQPQAIRAALLSAGVRANAAAVWTPGGMLLIAAPWIDA
jgi:hypothetical protein